MSIGKAKKRQRQKKQKPADKPEPTTTTKELAAEFGVGVRAVDGWAGRGAPFVKRQGRRFFDIQDVRKWLAANGLLPGARGVPGGKARARQGYSAQLRRATKPKAGAKGRAQGPVLSTPPIQAQAPKGKPNGGDLIPRGPGGVGQDDKGVSPGPAPGDDAATGLEAALGRVETVERELGVNIIKSLGDRATVDTMELQGNLRNYEKILGELRQATKGLIEVQQARRELIKRDDVLETLAALAVFLRTRVEALPREVLGRVVAGLAGAGVEVSDLAAFQRALQAELQEATDRFLEELSREAAGGPARLGISAEAGPASPSSFAKASEDKKATQGKGARRGGDG